MKEKITRASDGDDGAMMNGWEYVGHDERNGMAWHV